jgi:hypothetical protein
MASTRLVRLIATLLAAGLVAAIATAPSAAAPATGVSLAEAAAKNSAKFPPRPRLPANFSGRGRWIVQDLGENVPFTWEGRDGNSVMTAGNKNEDIYYKNLIYGDTLYTITYEWPGLTEEEKGLCVPFKGLDRRWLNGTLLKSSRYVGREILQGKPNRFVHHWRAGVVFFGDLQPNPGNPKFPRIPAQLTDIYVGQGDNTRWWKALQFGVQNQLDPALDEWLEMRTFTRRPGKVTLPPECKPVPPASDSASDFFGDLINALLQALQPQA